MFQRSLGLENFVNFIYYHGGELFDKGLKYKDKIYKEEFPELINQDNLLEKLEFFKTIKTDNK